MRIRPYRPDDAAALSALHYAAVREIGARDYSPEQVAAWAPQPLDLLRYETKSKDGRAILVAVDDEGAPIAYGELEPDGHIDHLYCRPDHVGTGVGWALVDELEDLARARGIKRLYVEASEAAQRMFLRREYAVVERRRFILRGVAIHNYLMDRTL